MFQLTGKQKKKVRRLLVNMVGWVVVGTVFAVMASIICGCQKEEPKIYRIDTSELVWETSEDNNRLKVPVVKDMVYFVVGGSEK